jgi:hypothetical protein
MFEINKFSWTRYAHQVIAVYNGSILLYRCVQHDQVELADFQGFLNQL